jgi:hypothetical protein
MKIFFLPPFFLKKRRSLLRGQAKNSKRLQQTVKFFEVFFSPTPSTTKNKFLSGGDLF